MGGEAKAIDYVIPTTDAQYLMAVVLLPIDMRKELLARYRRDHGAEALADLFAEFIGLSNSVVENNRQMVEVLGWISGDVHPARPSENANLPTIFGALNGVGLAARAESARDMCGGCAFRIGTPANQSPVTTLDAEYVEEAGGFLCHEDTDDRGELRGAPCRGHSKWVQTRKAAAIETPASIHPLNIDAMQAGEG